MTYAIRGLAADEFRPLFGLSEEELSKRGVIRKTATSKPGFPCRITLEDAEPGETLLLINYESHKADTPYRSSYAIFVRESALHEKTFTDELPPVLQNRPIALRIFNEDGHLIGADLDMGDDLEAKIETAFNNKEAAYIHAHNAKHGCFAAEIRRA
jgi:hypothetical protein